MLINLGFSAAAFLIIITVHEFAHGAVAYLLGDTTARDNGRLTLNPIKHLDPLGTVMLLITAFFGRGLGWAKPVPVNPHRFKNPRRDMLLTSIAGPLSNFMLALILAKIYPMDLPDLARFFVANAAVLSVWIGIFNLLPIPPLDGSQIIPTFLPYSMHQAWYRFEQYGMAILLILLFLLPGALGTIIGGPAGYIITAIFYPYPVPGL